MGNPAGFQDARRLLNEDYPEYDWDEWRDHWQRALRGTWMR